VVRWAVVLGAERIHADDTTVPPLAISGTQTARLWTYARDDHPFAGGAPPAALYAFSTHRRMEHPTRHGWTGILQADAYGAIKPCLRSGPETCVGVPGAMLVAGEAEVIRTGGIKATAMKGRSVAEWNCSAGHGEGPIAEYDFGWMWVELGLQEHRK